jgi:hypothetical protein
MAAQVPFALSPALVTNEVINYSTSDGQKLCNAAVVSLQDPCDGGEDGLHIFLEQLKTRAECMGWMTILDVPPDLAQPDEVINVISDYGQLSLQQIRDHATTYVQQQVRAAQDSAQLYQCLMHTLTKEALLKVKHLNSQANEGATDRNAGNPTLQLSQALANFAEAESDDNE